MKSALLSHFSDKSDPDEEALASESLSSERAG